MRRSATARLAFLVPAVLWLSMFPAASDDVAAQPSDLVVVQHNVSDTNAAIASTARVLLAASPDLVTLDEVTPEHVDGFSRTDVRDRALDPLTALVTESRDGFGFTFPARLPAVRIDHVLARGAAVTDVHPLGRTGSDHLPVVAHVDLADATMH